MGLIEDIAAISKSSQPCKFGRWLAEQDPKYQVEVQEALAAEFPTNIIWRVLIGKHGQFCSASVFARHRSRGCGCES